MKRTLRKLLYPIPGDLRARHTRGDTGRVKLALDKHYHQGWRAKETMTESTYHADLSAHMSGRLESDRRFVIPWLAAARPIAGAKILEIGSGTGSSTVALAEQRAIVTGIDIDEPALEVARERCAAHGVSADIQAANAADLGRFGPQDFVIYFATVEHMTIDERLGSLAQAWSILKSGGLLAIIETPNRLWWFDHHTAQLPFFNWLPDELAFAYSRFSPRDTFNSLYRNRSDETMEHFRRRGRGASYHEFELAIAPVERLEVVSSLLEYFGWRRTLFRTPRSTARYKKFLHSLRPDLHPGWFDQDLDLIIRKA
jgi:2-polyprenyl-3-methyl-5-hydroxy-6-metoxy-1,4-benzoquinol methylase